MSTEGVILLHGILRSSWSMRRLDDALRAAGYLTLNLDYPARRHGIETLADLLAGPVQRFADGLTGRLNLVTHSMGGLVARALIQRHRPARLGRVVMLAPPNQGSQVADLLGPTRFYRSVFGPAGAQLRTAHARAAADGLGPVDFELGIIAGDRALDPFGWAVLPKPNDGKVAVAATQIVGMADHIVLPATHTFIMSHPAAIQATLHFVKTGRFPRPMCSPSW